MFISAGQHGPPVAVTDATPGKALNAVTTSAAVPYSGKEAFVDALLNTHIADPPFIRGIARNVIFMTRPSMTGSSIIASACPGVVLIFSGTPVPLLESITFPESFAVYNVRVSVCPPTGKSEKMLPREADRVPVYTIQSDTSVDFTPDELTLHRSIAIVAAFKP
jgi:hypothetical protein